MENTSIWTQIAASWNDFKRDIHRQWGKLTENDLQHIRGQRDILLGKLQRIYGMSRDEANQQIVNWEQRFKG
ncbi:MAG: hypothetical protein U0528_11590 [Anaerolineae bacterium]